MINDIFLHGEDTADACLFCGRVAAPGEVLLAVYKIGPNGGAAGRTSSMAHPHCLHGNHPTGDFIGKRKPARENK